MSVENEIKEIGLEELPPALMDYWKKAKASVEKSNHAYAVKFLQVILKEAPGFVEGRQLLRSCEAASVGSGKVEKKKGLFGTTSSGGGFKLTGLSKKNPVEALVAIEKELENDPYNEGLNDLLHDTALRLNLLDTAAFALETVRKAKGDNTKPLHKLAEFYMSRSMPLEASDVYRDIVKRDPADGEAVKGEKDASAKASMQKGGWEQADANTQGAPKRRDTEEALELEKASRSGMTREQLEARRDEVVAEYEADPHNLAVVKNLAGTYEDLEDWASAQQFYEWAYELSNSDVALKNNAAAMKLKVGKQQIKELEDALEADPANAEIKARLDETRSSIAGERLVECRERVEGNPTDPQLRFDLGQVLYETGEYSEAIKHLQQATRNPHIRTRVLLLLGRTFDAKGMTDLAIKQLSDANSELITMDNVKKEILYELGVIYDKAGKAEEALECFKQIYEVDYGYLDVAERVEGSYSG